MGSNEWSIFVRFLSASFGPSELCIIWAYIYKPSDPTDLADHTINLRSNIWLYLTSFDLRRARERFHVRKTWYVHVFRSFVYDLFRKCTVHDNFCYQKMYHTRKSRFYVIIKGYKSYIKWYIISMRSSWDHVGSFKLFILVGKIKITNLTKGRHNRKVKNGA